MKRDNEVCPTCGCFEHCSAIVGPTPDGQGVGTLVVCEHCEGDPPHRPRCQWSEANLAEQHGSDVRDAVTFYPHLPSDLELRECLEDVGLLDHDHCWTDLGNRVGEAVRAKLTTR